MNKLLKNVYILMGMYLCAIIFMACPNNAQNGRETPDPKGTKNILIKSVTLDGSICGEGKDVFVANAQAELIVELKEAYEDISVKVNNTPVNVTGKTVAKYNLQGITEAGINVKIELTAKNKNLKTFNFVARKAEEILIASVRLDGKPYTENEIAKTSNTTSVLSVTFKEAYQELNVKVNKKDAKVEGKVATASIESITETGVDIEIVATAKNKAPKTFKFKVVLKLEEMGVEKVTFDGNLVFKDSKIETNKTEGDVSITFEESYEDLKVKVNNEDASLSGKVATKKISNISEEGTDIKIEATAKGRKLFSYEFNVKKLNLNEIGIKSVTFEGTPCPENKTTNTEKQEGVVKVTFFEEYTGLQVQINNVSALVDHKEATHKIFSIADTEVNINATATGKTPKEYKFRLHRELPVVSINSLTIEAKEIGEPPNKDQKTYSESVAPLLTEIANDGSTKVGVTRDPKIKIKIMYKGSPSEQKLKVENTTTNKSVLAQYGTWGAIDTDPIELKKGDNNIVVTYSEKGFKDLVYRFIVEYMEPEYEPIKFISIGGIEYKTKEELEKLTSGTESFMVDAQLSINVQVEMPEVWYKDEGWSIKVGGADCPNTDFKKVGFTDVIYRLTKDVPLTEGGTKVVKIEFSNTTRSFTKEYKANVTHKVVHKLKTLIFMNPAKENREDGRKTYSNYQFETASSCYVSATYFGAEDREDKALFAVETEDEAVEVKYAFSQTKLKLDQITDWKPTTKETISYKDSYYLSQTVTAFAIKDQKLEFGSNFLYLCLQKGSIKTYYMQEIQRERLPADNTEKDSELQVYKDADGNVVQEYAPITKKGLIRVLPVSPRATVELATPLVKPFILNTSDGYYECEIELTEKTVPYSYNIIAEDGTTKQLYAGGYGQEFTISEAIGKVRHGYKVDLNSWEGEPVSQIDGKWYVNFDKVQAINKKIYLFVGAFTGVSISHPEFVEKKKDNSYGTNYVFEVDVSSIIDTPNSKKEYTIPLSLNGKSCGNLEIVFLSKNEIIQGIRVCGATASLMPEGHYVCKANMNAQYDKKLIVWLYFIDADEKKDPETTNRAVKVFKDGVEIPMAVYRWETNKLQFENNSFNIADKEKITLKIQYFVNKTQTTTPTKEYTLEIDDL